MYGILGKEHKHHFKVKCENHSASLAEYERLSSSVDGGQKMTRISPRI
jgi:hypothetical protein